eukprot:TRINITY_DN44959_c0_g1_i1.p1 TRINITY_DN44959_c0_g1~~TRINITY_DN44959_c0_g1_i1.p1  ORF type:complete len:486 (+),score=60.21 TRINITY_DN44959_c0_g1_i1:136-1593(+)
MTLFWELLLLESLRSSAGQLEDASRLRLQRSAGSTRSRADGDLCTSPGALVMDREVHKRSCVSRYNTAWDKDPDLMSQLWTHTDFHAGSLHLDRYYQCVDRWPWTVVELAFSLQRYVSDLVACSHLAEKASQLGTEARQALDRPGQLLLCVPGECTAEDIADFIFPFWMGATFSSKPTELFLDLPAPLLGHHLSVDEYDPHIHRLEVQQLALLESSDESWLVEHGKDTPGDCDRFLMQVDKSTCKAYAVRDGYKVFGWIETGSICCFKRSSKEELSSSQKIDNPHVTLHIASEGEKQPDDPAGDSLRLAVCIKGETRTFSKEAVHQSIKRHGVESLGAAEVRIFYVLNLTSTHCHHCETQLTARDTFGDLSVAFEVLPPTGMLLEAGATWEAAPPCSNADRHPDQVCSPAAHAMRALCWEHISTQERLEGRPFDWILSLRPDYQFLHPIGPLRSFDPAKIHTIYAGYADPDGLFGLVPRTHAEAY